MSPTTVLNVRGELVEFQEPSIRQHQGIFDPATLGFPSAANQFLGDNKYFPRIEFAGGMFGELGTRTPAGRTPASIRSSRPWKSLRQPRVRAGDDFRVYREEGFPSYHAAGRYEFGRGSANPSPNGRTTRPRLQSVRNWRR